MNIKNRILIELFLVVVIAAFLILVTYEYRQGDTLEIARRCVSKNAQIRLFQKISEYEKNHSILPSNLETLVQKQYLTDDDIITFSPIKGERTKFNYYPNNYGDPNSVILSDIRDIKGLKRTKLKSAIIETYGDGSVGVREY